MSLENWILSLTLAWRLFVRRVAISLVFPWKSPSLGWCVGFSVCLFGWFWFFFPILHGKFQIAFGDFLYLHTGSNSDQVAINPKLQNWDSTFTALTVQSMCAVSPRFSESISPVLWTWRDTVLVQRVWHVLQNLCAVVDLHSTRWNAENPFVGSWKNPPASHLWGRIGLSMSLLCQDPRFNGVDACVFRGYKHPQEGKHSKTNWWRCLAIQDGKEHSCWNAPNSCLREHSTHAEGWKIFFTAWSDVTN